MTDSQTAEKLPPEEKNELSDVQRSMTIPQKNDLVKFIGAMAMLIDHIGALFFPQSLLLRAIGRLALPIFLHQLTISYRTSKNRVNLAVRILIAGIVAQPFYGALFPGYFNVMFSLLYCMGIFWCWEHFDILGKVLAVGMVAASFKMYLLDGAFYGMAIGLGFFIFPLHDNDERMLLGFIYQVAINYFYSAFYHMPGQLYALAALIPIMYPFQRVLKLPRYYFYAFYPAHLAVLWGVTRIIV